MPESGCSQCFAAVDAVVVKVRVDSDGNTASSLPVAAATPVYKLFGAAENLIVRYPACGHEFPGKVRIQAYEWLDRVLK